MGSPHLEEELIGGVVYLDLLFLIPQKYARIIRGKREGASSSGSTMEVYFMLKNPKTFGEEDPFYSPQRKLAVWGKTGFPVEFPVGPKISG
jgi:hypothetical protein